MLTGKNPYFCHSFCTTKVSYLPQTDNFTYSPLLSFNYSMSDSTEYAFNLGFGLRNYFPYIKTILGINIFYDIKHFNLDKFHQIGLGFESLSFLEVRTNFYLPITKMVQSKNYHQFNSYRVIEYHTSKSLTGCEVEIGKRIQQKFLDFYFSVAPYWVFNRNFGIEYKTQLQLKSISLGINVYQHFACRSNIGKGRGETVVGIIGINIPLGADSSDKKSSIRIPISRWDPIRTCLNITYKEEYRG
ncbi:MAG: inverse autotransporter beta domain-containing protein [Chlamydiales bacterium]